MLRVGQGNRERFKGAQLKPAHDPGIYPAAPPRAPEIGPATRERNDRERLDRQGRETVEHRSVLRGLILLAVLSALVSLWRAGLGRTFYAGWWRQW